MSPGRTKDLWITAFLVAVFGPILLRVVTAERQTFWHELVTVTGLLSVSLLVCAVILPARLRSITRAFGIETVLAGHRVLGLCAAMAALVHVVAVVVPDPSSVTLLVPFLAPLRSTAGLVALACLVALVLSATRRPGRYEAWRGAHLVLTAGVLGGVVLHVVLIGHLVSYNGLVQDPVTAGFLAALAVVVVTVELHRWVLRSMRRHGRYRVARVHALAPSVSTLVLRPDNGVRPALVFRPGQFAWLRLTRGPFTEEHPFTISSAAQDGPTVEFTIRHSGDWTTGPLRRLREGDFVWIDGPHGSLTPDESVSGLVLIAGGVGIAPMMSILRTAAREGDRRPVRLVMADRPGEQLYRAELEQLSSDLALQIHELHGAVLTPALLAALLPPPWARDRLDYYVCGSPFLVQDVITVLGTLDVPIEQVHTERFDS